MEKLKRILNIVKKQNEWRRKSCINLVASENVMSPLAEKVYISDFEGRYNEHNGVPHYHGTKYAMEIEEEVKEIFSKRFKTSKVELRPLSGGMANLIVMKALTKYGDVIFSPGLPNGAHVSSTRYGAAGILGLKDVPMYYEEETLTLDVDKTVELFDRVKPKLIILGRSVILFPELVKELRENVGDTPIMYDAAHVLGLIWGGKFQEPLNEGADIMTASTHKTFPGPQGGVIVARDDLDEKLWSRIETVTFPGLIYNHHIHRFPSLGITALEMNEFGNEYAEQIIKNAKTLARALYNLGFKVLGKSKGFTESHQVLVDVREFGGGKVVGDLLEENNIIITKIALPWDSPKDATGNPSGIRIGVQEMTRFGMKEKEMKRIAEFFYEILIEKKNVKEEVIEFRMQFQKVHYCFEADEYESYLA